MKPKIGIIGIGNIGSELYRRLQKLDWDVKLIVDYDGVYSKLPKIEDNKLGKIENYKEYLIGLDLVFLAIPTSDDGTTALNYIKSCLERNIPIVTCEKGALSNHFLELKDAIKNNNLGYSAAVGGGTRLLGFLQERIESNIEEIHAVLNGTLNYIFDGLLGGKIMREVVEETIRLKYSEPGASDALDIINKEASGDIPMKAIILFNLCNFTKEKIRLKELKIQQIESDDLIELEKEARERRYIVSITKKSNESEDIIGGFRYIVGDWNISAGFKLVTDNPLFKKLVPSGVNNAILISEGENGEDGIYILTGPGAGPGPTVNSMIIDAKQILGLIN